MKNVGRPNWQYYLSYVAEERRDHQPGAAHGDDIAFVMQTLDVDLESVSERDREMSRLMNAYWVQFAKAGNPNRDGLPVWPEYSEEQPDVLEFGDEIVVRDDLLSDRIEYHKARGKQLLERSRHSGT